MAAESSAGTAAETPSKSLWRLSAFQAVSSGSALLLFLLLIVAGRLLGPEDFGRFSFALAFVFLFDVILDPGLYHYLIREIARAREQAGRLLAHALTWKLFATPVVVVLIMASVNAIHDSPATLHAVYMIAFAHVLRSAKECLRAPLIANELFGLDAFCVSVERILLLVAGSAVLLLGGGLLGLCLTFIVVRVFDLGIALAIVRKFVCRVGLFFELNLLRKMVLAAAPIGAFYVTITVYNYVDTVMLSALRDEVEVGWYGAAYRIYEGLFMLPAIVSTVFMPRLSTSFEANRELFDSLFSRGSKYVFLLGLVVAVNLGLLAEPVITLSFGSDYSSAVLALQILVIGVPVVFVLNFCQTCAITMDRQRLLFIVSVIGLGINVILNAIFIPLFGLFGAASVTVCVEFIVLLSLLSALRNSLSAFSVTDAFLRPLFAVVVPLVAVKWGMLQFELLWRLAAVNASILVLVLVLRVFNAQERREIRRICGRAIG